MDEDYSELTMKIQRDLTYNLSGLFGLIGITPMNLVTLRIICQKFADRVILSGLKFMRFVYNSDVMSRKMNTMVQSFPITLPSKKWVMIV